MKIYHCDDPKENPVPLWMRQNKSAVLQTPEDPVERFKRDPDSFSPSFTGPERRKPNP